MEENEKWNVRWDTASRDCSESMPFGGCSIGGNLWAEDGCVWLYLAQSGWFDENNSLLKAGRWRLSFDPTPFGTRFSQTLRPEQGEIRLEGGGLVLTAWAEPTSPRVHLEIKSEIPRTVRCEYQSWRTQNRRVSSCSYELFQCKEVFFYPQSDPVFFRDTVEPSTDSLVFYHKNRTKELSFQKEMEDQGLSACADGLYNPQKDRIMGGWMRAERLVFRRTTEGRYRDTPYAGWEYESPKPLTGTRLDVCLLAKQPVSLPRWRRELQKLTRFSAAKAKREAESWWQDYFAKSYLELDPAHPGSDLWKIGRNAALFRYMMGFNYYGFWPTKFNGGLLTFDPSLGGQSPWSDDPLRYTPDFRLWGGGSHTIQNQRLLYWPMLRAGDFEPMRQHFDFFLRILPAACVNVREHLRVRGAFFPEQVGTYGLCCGCDNEWGNRTGLPVTQIKYHFSNSLETCLMILDYHAWTGEPIEKYLPLIDAVLEFYDSFYPENDKNGNMVIYPANALESYHVVKNPVDAIAGLKCVLTRLLSPEMERFGSPEQRARWAALLARVPPLPTVKKDGVKILAYAATKSPRHNCELPQLYAVHPYGLYGLGKPGLRLAVDTALHCAESDEQLTHVSWHPTGIQYARLGMLPEAMDFLKKKLLDGPFRFPAFWGPGHDWTPDHNWGGSGVLQLQEMLLQADGRKILLFPCWPSDADVSFRLFAPYQTVVECRLEGGRIQKLSVTPESRKKDVVNFLGKSAAPAE
jgi:hypothetical protein